MKETFLACLWAVTVYHTIDVIIHCFYNKKH